MALMSSATTFPYRNISYRSQPKISVLMCLHAMSCEHNSLNLYLNKIQVYEQIHIFVDSCQRRNQDNAEKTENHKIILDVDDSKVTKIILNSNC